MQEHTEPRGPLRTSQELILASRSPRRQALLASLGLHFQVRPSPQPEPKPKPGQDPTVYCQQMARLKAESAADKQNRGLILAADTIVVLEEEILGKPQDLFQALDMLCRLNGVQHRVITGCFLQDTISGAQKDFAVTTWVGLGPVSEAVLQGYVHTQQPLDKAGGYGIQELGGALVSSIQGSYSNVVGLPMHEVLNALLELDALHLEVDSQ
ncbi:MAG: Maf family protein [Desulfohalobiaceae bacterium]